MSAASLASLLAAHARLLTARRPGLAPGAALPPLERRARGVVADPAWLVGYRRVCGLADDGALPTLAPQLMAAPLHLALLADRSFPIAAMGTWTVARALAECLDDLPPWPRVVEARFRKPVPLPSSVAISAWRRGDGALDITVAPPRGGTAHVELRVAPSAS